MENTLKAPARYSFNLHWIAVISLLYLALSGMMFFGAWFAPWAAWPVNMGILAAIAWIASKKETHDILAPGCNVCAGLILAAILCLFTIIYAGVLGFVQPFPDVLIFREALFNNLTQAPWPLVLPDGKEMSYYLAGVLPPALLARFTEDYTCQRIIATIWYSLGMWLAILLVYCRHGRFSWLFLLFIFFLKDPTYIIVNSFSGTGEIWALLGRLMALPENDYIGAKTSVFCLMGSGQTCHFTPCTMLATVLVLYARSLRAVLIPLTVALLIPISPLGAIGLLPLAALSWFGAKKGNSKEKIAGVIISSLIALLCAVYYLRAESETCLGLLGNLQQNWKGFLINEYACTFLCGILWAIVLGSLFKYDKTLIVSLVCYLISPWIYFGSTPESGVFGNNELWLKTGIIYHTHFIAALCFHWKQLNLLKYLFLGATILLTIHQLFQEKLQLTGSAIVPDVWNGHLHHTHPSLHQKIPACKKPAIPGILLKGGEAEQHFPWNILPAAKGCDYSRPAQPDGYHIRY